MCSFAIGLRKRADAEDGMQDKAFLVDEIARSEFVKILKSSRRFEYRLCPQNMYGKTAMACHYFFAPVVIGYLHVRLHNNRIADNIENTRHPTSSELLFHFKLHSISQNTLISI